ncbi:MAG: RhuM family protein [Bacteroidota bacterium]|jgi:hypothetical protein
MKTKNILIEAPRGEIILYKAPDGSLALDVKLEEETVWLTQAQMVKLFENTKQNISLHINNIFKEGELLKNSVVKEYLTTAADGKRYKTNYYNLDVIISVGYRVKSKRGTQFRIWANKILKEYLIKGYALNERRLNEQTDKLRELEKLIDNFSLVTERYQLEQDVFSGILKVVSDYTRALDLLDQYDYQSLRIKGTAKEEPFKINYNKAKKVIDELKISSARRICLEKKKIIPLKAQSLQFIKHLAVKNCTQALTKRRQIFYTS